MSDPTMLERVLSPEGLRVMFQPVLQRSRTGWRLHALEGLVRGPEGTNLEGADVLFEYVRRKHEEALVDRECIRRILEAASGLPGSPRIALNAHASTLGRDRGFPEFLAAALSEAGVQPTRVIVELVEHSPVWDQERLHRALQDLRAMGTYVALDDVGLGLSNMRMILETRPDYFKVDRYLVAGSSADFYRRALLRSLTDLAGSFGALAVAEGVEDPDDLGTVLAEGFTLVQGFLLAPPLPPEVVRESQFLGDAEFTVDTRHRPGPSGADLQAALIARS